MSSFRLEKEWFAESFICPQWLPGGQLFWYRQELVNGGSKFTLVDIPNKSATPAFDHERLSAELSKLTDDIVVPDMLPFTWIEIEDGAIRFRFKQQIWEYSGDNTLSKFDGCFTQANPALMYRPRPRCLASHTHRVSVNFVNNTRKGLDLYTVDESCRARYFMYLAQGNSWTQRTRAGNIWRFQEEGSGILRGTYCVPNVAHDKLVVGDVNFDEYWGRDNGIDEKSSNNLPPEWEEHEDEKGRTYFVNTLTDFKTWSHPAAINKDDKSDHFSSGTEPAIFVSGDGNLWVRDLAGVEIRLLSTASEDVRYDPSKVFSSPNNKLAVVWQKISRDDSNVAYNINYLPDNQLQPKLMKREAPIPGDRISISRPRLFDLIRKQEIETHENLFPNPYELQDLGWSGDGTEYRFLYKERGHQCIRVLSICNDGGIRILLEEKSQTFIDNTKFYYHLLANPDTMIWASERDGYNHLYMIDLKAGKVRTQITTGNWNIYVVECIDEDKEELWVSAYGFWENQDPYHLHLIYVKFDGTGCRALTEGDGTHIWSWPPNGQKEYFVDTWSRVDLPPQTVVRSLRIGELHFKIQGQSFDSLKEMGWDPAERFVAPGRDGQTLIYGIIIRPPNFKKNIKYPILENIYAGPQTFFTPKSFGKAGELSSWAVGGYVVVLIDAMGTNWRSKKFHDVCFKNLNDGGFPDRILWIKEAAKMRPWMDLAHVGILGGSAGGDNALAALLHYGDFYKVAVADSGEHDHRIGSLWWNEQWLGYPVDDSYDENSNITHVKSLQDQAKLMLVAGGLDHAVNPACTMRLAVALNREGKDYDFLFIPEGGHNCGTGGKGVKRVRKFLQMHLGTGRVVETT